MSFDKKELVVKSNRLVEASYRLTLTEQRMILLAIARSRDTQTGLLPGIPVTISAKNYAKQFAGVDEGSVYSQLKAAIDTLYERSVTIHDTDPETQKPRVRSTRWINEKAYIDGAGNVQLVFTPEVVKYFTRLEGTLTPYTSYGLEKVGGMSSFNSIRIYEMLAQHKGVGHRTINLAWLREKLELEPTDYKLTADLKRWVLDPAVAQINKHSDLKVDYKSVKTGRAITDFAFTIKDKTKPAKPKAPKKPPIKPTDQDRRDLAEANGQGRLPQFEDGGEEF